MKIPWWRGVTVCLIAWSAALHALAQPKSPTTAPTLPAAVLKPAPENLADLKALQATVKEVLATVAPAVVGLRVGGGQGSGVIVTADGYVLTAGHVSASPGRDVAVLLSNGKQVKGKTLGCNYGVDSGLIKITDPGPDNGKWPFVEMGKSSQLQRGQWCVALGHPGGYKSGRTAPLRLGKILDTRGTFVRTDCTLVGGDSGGPLFDLAGKVIAIHSRIGSGISDNMHVPVDTYRDTWERLDKGEAWGGMLVRPNGPWLGVQVDPDAPQCRIEEVFANSPAQAAGLKVGDIIETFDGQKIRNMQDLLMRLQAHRAGDEVVIELSRDAKKQAMKVTLARRPQ